jgi:cation diffusion facilitator CzcD-associated flavoprotein CzcO
MSDAAELPAVVVGAGQAGLAMSHELARVGVEHVVLERDHVGASWAGLWDSFRLNTPNWSIRLPGGGYEGDEPDGFLSRAGIVEHLRRYGDSGAAEIREGVEVTSLIATDTGFALGTDGETIAARTVIVCTGAYQAPYRPPGAEALEGDLPVIDTRSYRDAASLPDGRVLVVGSGQSGCQIGEDLLDAGRDVIVSCGRAAWGPRRIGEHDIVWWVIETGFFGQTPADLPSPAARLFANVTASGADGGHDLHPRILRDRGATLAGRFSAVEEGRIRFADDLGDSVAWGDARYRDLRADVLALCQERGIPAPDLPDPDPFDPSAPDAVDVTDLGVVIVSGGFRPGYERWIALPGAFDEQGFPNQRDGASSVAPGLFFAGVHFLRKRQSSLLCGVGEDAAIVARGVADHLASSGEA